LGLFVLIACSWLAGKNRKEKNVYRRLGFFRACCRGLLGVEKPRWVLSLCYHGGGGGGCVIVVKVLVVVVWEMYSVKTKQK
jgi:hypothetical protein